MKMNIAEQLQPKDKETEGFFAKKESVSRDFVKLFKDGAIRESFEFISKNIEKVGDREANVLKGRIQGLNPNQIKNLK